MMMSMFCLVGSDSLVNVSQLLLSSSLTMAPAVERGPGCSAAAAPAALVPGY